MNYQLIYLPLGAMILTQIIKLIVNGVKGKFTWNDINGYGGMPSSHSSLVTALFASVGFYHGWDTPEAAIALIFAIITMRDAAGFRMMLGLHAKEINQIIHEINPQYALRYPHLVERIGHTPMQVFIGSLIGAMVVVLHAVLF